MFEAFLLPTGPSPYALLCYDNDMTPNSHGTHLCSNVKCTRNFTNHVPRFTTYFTFACTLRVTCQQNCNEELALLPNLCTQGADVARRLEDCSQAELGFDSSLMDLVAEVEQMVASNMHTSQAALQSSNSLLSSPASTSRSQACHQQASAQQPAWQLASAGIQVCFCLSVRLCRGCATQLASTLEHSLASWRQVATWVPDGITLHASW